MIIKLLVNRLKEAKAKVAEQENVMLVLIVTALGIKTPSMT